MEKYTDKHDTLNQLTALALAKVAFIEDVLDMVVPAAESLLTDTEMTVASLPTDR